VQILATSYCGACCHSDMKHPTVLLAFQEEKNIKK